MIGLGCNTGRHAIREKHLPRYLAEFYYRFNRRFRLGKCSPGSCMWSFGHPLFRIAWQSWLRMCES